MENCVLYFGQKPNFPWFQAAWALSKLCGVPGTLSALVVARVQMIGRDIPDAVGLKPDRLAAFNGTGWRSPKPRTPRNVPK